MKIRILTIICCLLMGVAEAGMAQRTVEKTLEARPEGKVELNLPYGDTITVKAWDREEVSFRAEVEINGGKLNDALVFEFGEGSSGISIAAEFDEALVKQGRREDCPTRGYSTISWSGDRGGYAICTSITYTVYVPRHSDLAIETISGNVELEGLQGPVHAKSISGFVDMNWPSDQPADLSLKTISGEAFSDLDSITFSNRKKSPPIVGYRLRGTIGRGGPDIHLESVSGDIYLRES